MWPARIANAACSITSTGSLRRLSGKPVRSDRVKLTEYTDAIATSAAHQKAEQQNASGEAARDGSPVGGAR